MSVIHIIEVYEWIKMRSVQKVRGLMKKKKDLMVSSEEVGQVQQGPSRSVLLIHTELELRSFLLEEITCSLQLEVFGFVFYPVLSYV